MKIPVFVSCPSKLNSEQEASRQTVVDLLEEYGLEPRALGRSDYPTESPLREVAVIAKHCSGGVILGFEQFRTTEGVWKRGTKEEEEITDQAKFPTPWNHLEAGILFGLKLPLLVFREEGISGGIFDSGTTDVYVHETPPGDLSGSQKDQLKEVIFKWRGRVSEHYYQF